MMIMGPMVDEDPVVFLVIFAGISFLDVLFQYLNLHSLYKYMQRIRKAPKYFLFYLLVFFGFVIVMKVYEFLELFQHPFFIHFRII